MKSFAVVVSQRGSDQFGHASPLEIFLSIATWNVRVTPFGIERHIEVGVYFIAFVYLIEPDSSIGRVPVRQFTMAFMSFSPIITGHVVATFSTEPGLASVPHRTVFCRLCSALTFESVLRHLFPSVLDLFPDADDRPDDYGHAYSIHTHIQ